MPAASSAGIDMKKLSRVAVTRSSPRNSPTEIVAPEREMPGIRATAWARPIRIASRQAQVALGAILRGHPLGQPHHRAPADQGHRDHPQRAQVVGDEVLGQQPDHADGDGGDDDVPAHPVVELAAVLRLHQPQRPGPHDVPDVPGEVDDHRGDGAHLDHGRVAGHRRVVDLEPEHLLRDRQVAGARDRQELGQPLHHAEHDGVEVVHVGGAYGGRPAAASRVAPPDAGGRLRCAPCSTGPWVAPASRSRGSAWG